MTLMTQGKNDELTKTGVNTQTFIWGSTGKQIKLIKLVETIFIGIYGMA